jgi:threonine/homoserine/homoserine lactone efflux protein
MTDLLARAVVLGFATGASPLGLIAVLVVIGERNRRNGAMFVLGWTTALAAIVVTAAFVVQPATAPDVGTDANTLLGVLELVGAVAAAAAAVWLWRRPEPDPSTVKPSKTLQRLDGVRPWGAFVGGTLVPTYPPALVFGAELARTTASDGQRLITLVVFLVLTTFVVITPVLGLYVAPERTAARLGALRAWTERHRAQVGAVLLGVLALVLTTSGLEHIG